MPVSLKLGLTLAAVVIGSSPVAQAQIVVGQKPPAAILKNQKDRMDVPGPVYSARDIRLQIETRRSTFRAGDPIEVRLSVHNQSAHIVRYIRTAVRYQAELSVLDAREKPVERVARQPVIIARAVTDSLQAGRTLTLSDGKGREWFNLLDWSYDLSRPGTYTIVGVPDVTGPKLTRDTTLRSNRVTITITK